MQQAAYEVEDSDPREIPVYELLHRQRVRAEDVYLGADFTRDPSTSSSEDIVVRVKLPGVKNVDREVTLDVTSKGMTLTTVK